MDIEYTRKMMQERGLRIVETLHLECPKHGPYENNRILRYYDDGTSEELPLSGCPACREESARQELAESYENILLEGKLASSRIPAKFQNCMVRNFQVEDTESAFSHSKMEARNMAIAFIRDEVRSLVLLGGTGRGKSHLMASMLKGCISTGRDALYVVERKIYRDIHESYLGRKDLMTEGQVIDLYSKVDVLGIDELGRSSWTEHEAQILYEIIDNRDVYNRKTVMAGNLMPDEFRQKFDDSFRRKLGATTIVCTWPRWEEA